MNLEQLQEYTSKCHEAAKLNGWHEQTRTETEIILLIKSEMFEAFEAYRKQKYARTSLEKAKFESICNNFDYKNVFEIYVKDKFEDELADTAIRIFDAAGKFEQPLSEVKQSTIENLAKSKHISNDNKFMGFFNEFDTFSTSVKDMGIRGHNLSFLLALVLEICKRNEVDLIKHIELKLKYNSLRGHRHGGKIL